MKKTALFILIICFCATFALAQKTVRKRTKSKPIQITLDQTKQINSDSDQKISSRFDKPLRIIDKPRPQLFSDGQDCSQGKVVLRVTFLETGEIGTISIISSLTKNKTESAVEAAKQIKFEPASKDGKPVSVTKPVEYSFSIY